MLVTLGARLGRCARRAASACANLEISLKCIPAPNGEAGWRYDRLRGTPLFGLSPYALPFALSPVHTLIPSAAVAAAAATAAARACAAFIVAS
jgi:hypothetical protein